MAINKKTTLVIDHEAEEKAKQQAMERELAGNQPAKKTEIIKDNSVETNKSELKKIKSWTAKSVLIVVGICALIGLIVWSVLYKTHLDKKAAEEAERKKAEAVAVEKAKKAIDGKLSDNASGVCQAKAAGSEKIERECVYKERIDLMEKVIAESADTLPEPNKSELLREKLRLSILIAKNEDQIIILLDKAYNEFKKHDVNYEAFADLGGYYATRNERRALEAYKIAKQKHTKVIEADPLKDLDVHNFPETREQLRYLINGK